MQYDRTVEVQATPAEVWAVLTDVEAWPQWTASMEEIRRLDSGPLALGSRARVKQPRFPASNWVVTGLDPERSFSWTSKSGGVTTVADHEITPTADGVSVRLAISQSGLMARVIELAFGSTVRRYVDAEANGLKQRSEGS